MPVQIPKLDTKSRIALQKLSAKTGGFLTSSRIMYFEDGVFKTISDLTNWIAGTANEVDVTDDGDGTVTIGIVNPLIVGKGGTGLAALTDHSLLVGSGADAVTLLGEASNGQIPIGSTGADPVLAGITGTANQVTVTNAAGSITLSLPQDIATTSSPTFNDLTISNPSNIYALSHDSFADFVADEHVAHSGITITAGTGLSGGGTIDANVTINCDITQYTDELAQDAIGGILDDGTVGSVVFSYGDGTPLISATVQDGEIDHDSLNNFVANEHIDHTSVTLTAGTGLSGGGDISASRTFALDLTEMTGNVVWDDGSTDASITWTYALSGATDPQWTISNGSMDLTAGNLYVGGVEVMLVGDSPTAHLHDGDTLEHDGVNSDGGAFAFNTTGTVTFNNSVTLDTGCDITVSGHVIFNTNNSYIGFTSPRITFDDDNNLLAITGNIVVDDDASIGVSDDSAKIVFDTTLNRVLVTGSLESPEGDIRSGDDDTTRGCYRAYGGATGYGGSFYSYTAADSDDDIEYFMFTAHDDDCYVCYADGIGSIITVTGPACNVGIATDLGVTGAITASNYTAANLLTACTTNAGALDFSVASKTLTVEDDAVVSQDYSSDGTPTFGSLVIADTGTIGSATDTDIMTLAADGTCTFSVFPVTPSAAPDADYEVANKKYVDDGGGANDKVKIDAEATAGYLGAASNDGVLRTGAGLSYTDGGDFITIAVDEVLEDLDTLGANSADGDFLVGTAAGALAWENGATARTSLGLGSAAVVNTDLADLNEATIEAAIDTLVNLTSVQNLTVTLADAGTNAIFGWDDTAGAYENLTVAEASAVIDHDQTTNFVANEHIDHTAITLTAGTGLTGGGDISSNRTFAVDGVLEDLDTLGISSADGEFLVATGEGTLAWESGITARTSIGLGNVEDTALSSWAGTSNITTLGTINQAFHINYGSGALFDVHKVTIADEASATLESYISGTHGLLFVVSSGYAVAGCVFIEDGFNAAAISFDPLSTLSVTDVDGKLCILSDGDGTYSIKNRLGSEVEVSLFFMGR